MAPRSDHTILILLSPETAALIGLQTGKVDFGAVEDVLTLSGIVRAAAYRLRRRSLMSVKV